MIFKTTEEMRLIDEGRLRSVAAATDSELLELRRLGERALLDSAMARFVRAAANYAADDQERIKMVLFAAGRQWGRTATADEIIAALDAAGFQIVRKPREASVDAAD